MRARYLAFTRLRLSTFEINNINLRLAIHIYVRGCINLIIIKPAYALVKIYIYMRGKLLLICARSDMIPNNKLLLVCVHLCANSNRLHMR